MTHGQASRRTPQNLSLPFSEGGTSENPGDGSFRLSQMGGWVRYILIALIIGFFAMPIAAVCFLDCKVYAAKKMAHVLLFFFR